MQISAFIPNFNIHPTQRQSVQYGRFSNLAPLRQDTVSFGASKKDMQENDMSQGINHNTALKIHNDAKLATNYLERQLDSILGDLVRPKAGKGSLSKPIEKIHCRPKTPKSIREKSGSLKLYTEKEVKEGMTDIIGARIVMADSRKGQVDEVINRLANAVNKDQIKILEIENYRPDPELDDNGVVVKSYDYASPLALRNLKLACESKGIDVAKRDEDLPSGYMAIHMLIKLPNGFTGEIQLMGKDVEQLKEVEDACYKVKNGKHLDKQFASVEKMLAPLANKEDTILRKGYIEYTRKAYIVQREKEPRRTNKIQEPEFLHIPESLNYIPPQLNFNNIYAEMKKCGFRYDYNN